MKFKSIAAIIAIAAAIASPMAHAQDAPAVDKCEFGMTVDTVVGETITTAGTVRTFKVSEQDAPQITGWGSGNELRLCEGDKLTNISFQTLPTYTVSEVASVAPVETPTETTVSTEVASPTEPVIDALVEGGSVEVTPDATVVTTESGIMEIPANPEPESPKQ